MPRRMKAKPNELSPATLRLLALLLERPRSYREYARALGVSVAYVFRLATRLRTAGLATGEAKKFCVLRAACRFERAV